MAAVIRCTHCGAEFDDAEVEALSSKGCPRCGSEDEPALIGSAALASALVGEYLEVKPRLLAGNLRLQEVSARQLAGNWILSFGRAEALAKFERLTRAERRRMEKFWPGFCGLLSEAR